MTTLLYHLIVRLDRLIARISNEEISATRWRITFNLFRLVIMLTMLIYWLIRLLEAFMKLA